MKRIINRKLSLMLAVIFITVPMLAQNTEALKEKVSKINREMAEAAVQGNMEKNLSYYAEDAISMPNNGKMLEGIDAIRKSTAEMMATGVKLKSFDVNTIYAVPCENMIIEVGKFKMSILVPGMPEPVEDEGKYLTIWEQGPDGSLKIKLETWNTDSGTVPSDAVTEAK